MLASFLPYVSAVRTSLSVLMSDYSARFEDPLLREAFNFVLYERHPAFPVLPTQFQLASHANLSAGVPEGDRSASRSRSSGATAGSAAG